MGSMSPYSGYEHLIGPSPQDQENARRLREGQTWPETLRRTFRPSPEEERADILAAGGMSDPVAPAPPASVTPPVAPIVPAGPAPAPPAPPAGRPAPRIGLQPGSKEWAEVYPESVARMAAATKPGVPEAPKPSARDEYLSGGLNFSWGGDTPAPVDMSKPRGERLTAAHGTPPASRAPSAETMAGVASRAHQPRPHAFNGMVGGIQTQGQLEQDAKAEGQFNDRWDARREQIDSEEQSASDTYLLGLKNKREARLLEEDPYAAYRRKSDIDREKAVGIKQGESRIRREEIGAILGEQEAVDRQIDAETSQKLAEIKATPGLPPEEMQRRIEEVTTRAENAKRAFQQQMGIATGKTPAPLYKDDSGFGGG